MQHAKYVIIVLITNHLAFSSSHGNEKKFIKDWKCRTKKSAKLNNIVTGFDGPIIEL